ncbi:MAG: hypothetical protein ABJC26_00675 [Gemmatimonadaceae bacterium]
MRQVEMYGAQICFSKLSQIWLAQIRFGERQRVRFDVRVCSQYATQHAVSDYVALRMTRGVKTPRPGLLVVGKVGEVPSTVVARVERDAPDVSFGSPNCWRGIESFPSCVIQFPPCCFENYSVSGINTSFACNHFRTFIAVNHKTAAACNVQTAAVSYFVNREDFVSIGRLTRP